MNIRHLHLPLFAVLPLVLTGCVTQRTTFENRDADEVWTAMVAVAKTPKYQSEDPAKRWHVRENQVWVDEANNRIEIYRKLDRILYQPASHPRYEDREWKFEVALEDRNPPTVVFRDREMGIPSHTWDEADHYFAEVRDLLAGAPDKTSPPQSVPQSQPVPPVDELQTPDVAPPPADDMQKP
jgi:hypothetical protein